MIRVPRKSGPPAGIAKLADKEETANRTRKKPSFNVYKDKRIKEALQELFQGKCAYCESRYAATQPMDVEHWRPKSVYPFLAAEWSNLLPSCIDCNRRREHRVPLPDGTETVLNLGKLDEFPISIPTPALDRAGLAAELPMLLNPGEDEPADHLEFTSAAVIRAKNGSPRAETSIRVYALNRMDLVHERYERTLLVGKHVHVVRILAAALERLGEKKRPDRRVVGLLQDLIAHEMRVVKDMCRASEPYALLTRQLFEEFLASDDGLPRWLDPNA